MEKFRDGQHSGPDDGGYMIWVKGHLDPSWIDWFEGWEAENTERGETLLSGPVQDQAALHGLLNRIRDMNLELLALCQVCRKQQP